MIVESETAPLALVPDRCGSCRRCLDACPTGALTAPGQMDARRCISYLTLEHKSEIPTEFHGKLSGYPAGCDLCQACCPHNAGAPSGREKSFRPTDEMKNLDLKSAGSMPEEAFRSFTGKSALERVKFRMWRRNTEANEPQ